MQIPNLRQWRELRGLTQQDLSRMSGVSLRSIAGFEAGGSPRPNTARKLAKALDVEVMDLAGVDAIPKGEAPPPNQPSFDELLDEARRNEWFRAYDQLGRQLFARWESELEEREATAGDNLAVFVVWIDGVIRTSNLYTAQVMQLDLDDGRPWPALANELDPELRDRDRQFWQRVQRVLQEIRPRVSREEFAKFAKEIEERAESFSQSA